MLESGNQSRIRWFFCSRPSGQKAIPARLPKFATYQCVIVETLMFEMKNGREYR